MSVWPVRSSSRRGRGVVPWPGRRRMVGTDPFRTLEVQMSLGRVERQIQELMDDADRFALAHHLRAATLAYDRLITEACELAGVEQAEEPGPIRRLIAEAELRTRGWSW